MTTIEIVILISIGVYFVTLVGGIFLALRFQRKALEREAEKRLALVRQQLQFASQQVDEYENLNIDILECKAMLDKFRYELEARKVAPETEVFVKDFLLQINEQLAKYVDVEK